MIMKSETPETKLATQILRDARDLIAAPERWTRASAAREGQWSASRAVTAAATAIIDGPAWTPDIDDAWANALRQAEGALMATLPPTELRLPRTYYAMQIHNTFSSHADVMAWFDRAITAIE